MASVTGALTHHIPTLTRYLKDMEVVIKFLALSVSAAEKEFWERPLVDYMMSIFGEGAEFVYLTNNLMLKHAKHIWFLLRYTQAGQFVNQNQV